LVDVSGQQTTMAGTSAAAPFWAAAMALTEQYAHQQGVRTPCFLAPILYQLGSTAQTYPAFHDISFGTNRQYAAKPGWDYATGLGSPDVWNLARDLVTYLRANPGACR
jgi:kumamolisin